MTWLRNHKTAAFEASVEEISLGLKDEPDWIIDQMLRRKRDEVVKQWQEKEAALERIRAKEKLLEGRGPKRRKGNTDHAQGADNSDQSEEEWLLADRGDDEYGTGTAASSFSGETRLLLETLGMGGLKSKEIEDDPPVANEIKV
jgi:chromosome transmission fidelity protein 1